MPSDGLPPRDPRLRRPWGLEQAEVLAHASGGAGWFKLTLAAPAIAGQARAGHFVAVAVHPVGFHGSFDPLLRRPFSICQIGADGTVTLIYRAQGRGTRLLSQVVSGQRLELMGPLGHSFPDPASGSGRLVLVGGGLGIPPMAAAAAWATAVRPVSAICGARSADGLAGVDEVAAAGAPVTVVTDDGSAGRQGLVIGPLQELFASPGGGFGKDVGEVWACGPEPMLLAVQDLCLRSGVPCWLSLERHMACGFGACMSCTVPRAQGAGYFKCCTDGPVFRAEDVRLGP